MTTSPYPIPRTLRLQLADKLERIAKDLRYVPCELIKESVEVEPWTIEKLVAYADAICEYQTLYERLEESKKDGVVATKRITQSLYKALQKVSEAERGL